MAAKQKKRFQLLLYKRYHETQRGLSQVLIVLGVLLLGGWLAASFFLGDEADPNALNVLLWCSLGLFFIGLLRLMFTLLVSKVACVECRPASLRIRTLFFPLVISYRRIKETRPSLVREIFPPETYKERYEQLLETLWGETAIVVRLNKLPMSTGLIKTLLGPLILDPNGHGLVLLVDDWMGFSRQLDQAINDYSSRRATPVHGERLYSKVMGKK
jgi:extradiol dioxygenase family protein